MLGKRKKAKREQRIAQFVHKQPPLPDLPAPSMGAQLRAGMAAAFPTVIAAVQTGARALKPAETADAAHAAQPIDDPALALEGYPDLEPAYYAEPAPHHAWQAPQENHWPTVAPSHAESPLADHDAYYEDEEPSSVGDMPPGQGYDAELDAIDPRHALKQQLHATMVGAFPTVFAAVAPQALERHRTMTAIALEPPPLPPARLELASRIRSAPKLAAQELPADSRRRAPRRATSTAAHILFDEISVPIRCRVVDQSASGARCTLDQLGKDIPFTVRDLPYDIRLIFPSERMAVDCRIVWRNGMDLGLKFQSAWKPYVPAYATRTSDNRKTQPAVGQRRGLGAML